MAKPGRKRTMGSAEILKAVEDHKGDFDPTALTVGVATLPPRTREATSGPNPFVAFLQESKAIVDARAIDGNKDADQGGRYVDVPGWHVRDVTGKIRQAATRLAGENIGVRVFYRWDGDNGGTATLPKVWEVEGTDQMVRVLFTATQRRKANGTNGTAPENAS